MPANTHVIGNMHLHLDAHRSDDILCHLKFDPIATSFAVRNDRNGCSTTFEIHTSVNQWLMNTLSTTATMETQSDHTHPIREMNVDVSISYPQRCHITRWFKKPIHDDIHCYQGDHQRNYLPVHQNSHRSSMAFLLSEVDVDESH